MALVLGILPTIVIGAAVGIWALVRINKSHRKGRGLAIAGLVLSGIWGLLLVVGAALGPDAERDDEGTITEAGSEDVFSLRVGDCWNNPPEGSEIQEVDAVPCSEAHDAEVYAEFDVTGESYPGVDEVIAQAEQGCYERFEGFVGLAPEGSTLEVLYLYPTQESWDRNADRQISCVISDPAGRTTGSLEGAAR